MDYLIGLWIGLNLCSFIVYMSSFISMAHYNKNYHISNLLVCIINVANIWVVIC